MRRLWSLLTRNAAYCAFVSVLLFPLLQLLVTGTAHSGQPVPTIWAAESLGVWTIDQTNGKPTSEIPVSPDAQTLAVDGQHKVIWVYSGSDLRSFDYNGNQLSKTLVNPPILSLPPLLTITAPLTVTVGTPALLTLNPLGQLAPTPILAVDNQANRVWLAYQNQINLFDTTGTLLKQIPLAQRVSGITLDRTTSRLWVAYQNALTVYDAQGNQFVQVNMADTNAIHALDYDFKLNQIWVAADSALRRYSPSGSLVFTKQNVWFKKLTLIAADQDGGLWATDAHQLAHLDATGTVGLSFTPYPSLLPIESIVSLVVDFLSHSVWISNQQHVTHYALDSSLLGDFIPSAGDSKPRVIHQLALPALPPPPVIQFTAPVTNTYLKNPSPTFSLTYSGDFIDLPSLKLTANGSPLSTTCTTLATSANCTPALPILDGAYDIVATIANTFSEISKPALVHITIDTVPPMITVASPANGFITNQKNLQINGSVSEISTLTINGTTVLDPNNQFSHGPVTLTEGVNTFQLSATDLAGNVGTRTLAGTLDTIPPLAPTGNKISTTLSNGQIAVYGAAGSVEGGSRVTVIDSNSGSRVTVTANANGSFSASLAGSINDPLQIYATDAAGNQGASTSTIVTTGTGGPFSGPITANVVTPTNGATVNGDYILVATDVQAPPNTGVTINGVIALPVPGPNGLRYFAQVPLLPGQNTLTVTITSQDGRSIQQPAINVTSTGPYPYRIDADRLTGTSPLDVQFSVVDQSSIGIQKIQIDLTSSGAVDYSSTDASAPILATYQGIGIQQAIFSITDSAGTTHSQPIAILLLDPNTINQNIQAIWSGINNALLVGNKAAAMQFLSPEAQDQYGPIFDQLTTNMPQIIPTYSALKPSKITASFSEYGVNRVVNGVNRAFLVDFVTNEFGQWELESM